MQNWQLLIENLQEKKLKEFLQNPFLDPEKTASFIKVISQILAKKGCSRQVRRFLQLKIFSILKRTVVNLDSGRFWKLFTALFNDEKTMAVFFEIFTSCDQAKEATQACQILLKTVIGHFFEYQKVRLRFQLLANFVYVFGWWSEIPGLGPIY